MTAFTGVGEATARTLGDDIHRIDELLNVETGALPDDVRAVVSSRYHDSLRVEVRHWYQKAIRNRSEDNLDSVDRQCLTGDLDWTGPLEDVDVASDAESMCSLFRDTIDPDDRLRITIETHGEFTAQVVGISHSEETHIGVEIEPASTPLESQGIIEVPAPYRSGYPIYRYSTNPTDSDPLTGDTIQLVRRVKITKVDTRN